MVIVPRTAESFVRSGDEQEQVEEHVEYSSKIEEV